VNLWFASKWENCTIIVWSTCSFFWNASYTNFKNNLKLPFAGIRNRNNGSISGQGNDGYYWSSSSASNYARDLSFDSSYIDPQSNLRRAYGLSVRCFKN
jgi:hypothetical protein